jgi:hypothetical protein
MQKGAENGIFLEYGIATGGTTSGLDDIKSDDERDVFGGISNAPYEYLFFFNSSTCHHLKCDTVKNINKNAITSLSRASANVIHYLMDNLNIFNEFNH